VVAFLRSIALFVIPSKARDLSQRAALYKQDFK
jgi:hypothetical protein